MAFGRSLQKNKNQVAFWKCAFFKHSCLQLQRKALITLSDKTKSILRKRIKICITGQKTISLNTRGHNLGFKSHITSRLTYCTIETASVGYQVTSSTHSPAADQHAEATTAEENETQCDPHQCSDDKRKLVGHLVAVRSFSR